MPKPGEVRRNQQKPEARLRHVKVSTNTRRIRNVRKTESQTSVLLPSNGPKISSAAKPLLSLAEMLISGKELRILISCTESWGVKVAKRKW